MKTLVIGYVPPAVNQLQPHAFLENLRTWRTYNRLVLYSDVDYQRQVEECGGSFISIRSPDASRDTLASSRWVANNLVFLTGLRIAASLEADRIIYLESDCRVGIDGWDKIIEEEFDYHPKALIGGSMVCFAPCNYDRKFAEMWADTIARNNTEKNFPIPTYGAAGSAERVTPKVFVNGALGIYTMEVLMKAFNNLTDTVTQAHTMSAWDHEVGLYLFREYRHQIWEKVAHLNSMFSSYGDVLTTEEDRRRMLENEFIAVHQIKSDWPGPAKLADAPEPAPEPALEPAPIQMETMEDQPPTGIFIVSFFRDHEWLRYCIRSIRKFAVGFTEVIVALPSHEREQWEEVLELGDVRVNWYKDAPDPKRHLKHVAMKCSADLSFDARTDYILHMDSDCIFTERVVPNDYFQEFKPVMLKEQYAAMENKQRMCWKEVTEKALGFETPYETMCRHPSVYPVWLYHKLRQHVSEIHACNFTEYVLQTQFPNHRSGFCEFNSLGGFALKFFEEHFHWVDVSNRPHPKNKLRQFFSHTGLDAPDVMNNDYRTPRQIMEDLGLL